MSDEVKSMCSASADTALDNGCRGGGDGSPSVDHGSSTVGSTPDDRGAIVLRRKKPIAGWRLAVIFACIGMGLFLSLLDATVVATMLVDISAEFQDFRTSSWVVLAYTLTEVGFAVAMARLSDALGRKTVACASFAVFLAASMGCAAAASLDQLIGFRAAQGVGGAGLYAMAMITYPELSPPSRVVLVTSALGVIVALAGVCGPVIGGLLTTYVGWRYVFWINAPCAFVPGVLLLILWPKDYQLFVKISMRRLDYLGAVLILSATVLPVFIINQAAIQDYAWRSATTISVLVIGGLCWVGLVVWQRQLARDVRLRHIRPQLPFHILTSRVMLAAIFDTFLSGFVLLLAIINIPLRSQIVNLYGPVKAGALLLPMMGGGAFGCALGGALSLRRNNTFPVLVAASAILAISSGVLSGLPDKAEPPAWQWGLEAVLGVGIGLKISSTTFLAVLQSDFEDHAISQGIIAQMRVFGGSLGVAISIIVLIAKIQSGLQDSLTPDQLASFYRSPLILLQFGPKQQLVARQAFIDAFRVDMYVCVGVSVASLLVALFTYQRHPPSVQSKLEDLERELARGAALMGVSETTEA
ncbi:Major facilitator superfamily domain, general substrate transporter [Cordyceps fumosorosea ARSEF 2679]|uniref:Major facilitator superfamily domain, general substrate transporter n=1 Tax=Cordyceps fumosorosea (strain ARSEF 2679) TaxID=1081104 RepID=A0A167RKU1_CORFA|nr:Major facilitator superfamily domain, general substrate transporter [Cordyceps fumosorosea ARSEF 2679]OAA58692.1 Major facilitator superfamily domain, general substrate transporter [Cordyceps fumosorosea ARSEF 2679]